MTSPLNQEYSLLRQTLLSLPSSKLLEECRVNKLFNDICNDDNFWHDKTIIDFGEQVQNPNGIPWNDVYQMKIMERFFQPRGSRWKGPPIIYKDIEWKTRNPF